ncbi:hypothetical protein GCM10027082_24110 [Comamonas humi]
MNALTIAQSRHDAALPPDYYEPDEDPVDEMLATDPAFALTHPNIFEGLRELVGDNDSFLKMVATLLSNCIDAEGKSWQAETDRELCLYCSQEIKALFRRQAEEKVAENRRMAIALEEA